MNKIKKIDVLDRPKFGGFEIATDEFTLVNCIGFDRRDLVDLFYTTMPNDFKKFIGSRYISHHIKSITDWNTRSYTKMIVIETDRGKISFIVNTVGKVDIL